MDFLATKGIEYLLVIGYLLLLIPFWMLLTGRPRRAPALAAVRAMDPLSAVRGWFSVPDGLAYHRGHTWARPVRDGVYRVGLDDFARRLLGPPDGVELPTAGARLEAGGRGFRLRLGDESIDLLSPLGGEVVRVNRAIETDPSRLCNDPYGDGWLCEVRIPGGAAAESNLLPARLARSWMEEASEKLSAAFAAELGPVLQDGGVPVPGFARQISPDRWHEVAAELLLTAGPPQGATAEGTAGDDR